MIPLWQLSPLGARANGDSPAVDGDVCEPQVRVLTDVEQAIGRGGPDDRRARIAAVDHHIARDVEIAGPRFVLVDGVDLVVDNEVLGRRPVRVRGRRCRVAVRLAAVLGPSSCLE